MFNCINPKNSLLRKIPYPYLGALSISNDIELMRMDFFEELMKFLNTNRKTLLGDGLNLEVTSSLFFFSVNPYNFSYFSSGYPKFTKSQYASRLNEYLKSKLIDTNHSYGDFDGKGGFIREYAVQCYNILNEIGVELKIFTNHGGEENNQNIGKDALYHLGDVKESKAYHADLMKKHGVQYVWTDSCILSEKKERFNYFFIPLKNSKRKNILEDIELQDGSKFKSFIRFRSTGLNAPNLSSLDYQLKRINWEKFYTENDVIIIYQHMGVLNKLGGECYPSTIDDVKRRPEIYLRPFYFLAKENKMGKLWISSLYKLLNYIDMINNVEINYNIKENIYRIEYMNDVEKPEIFFQGLTVYVNPQKPLKIYYKNKELFFSINGPDETGKYSVSIPLKTFGDIW
ncbi:MAG: hypothetical protein APR63_10645 [Desulfuromonas sp. SDB]|nr:MAG: hypothetical protein APR63_10645 [Desulfuromonas sp. SDB]